MTKKHTFIFLAFLGLFLAIGSIVAVVLLDRPLTHPQPLLFYASTGDSLVGTYHAGEEPFGVILLEGFGSDQVTMTSLASEFAREGWHVMTFDFSGHGRSPGTLTFDNAQTDRLAYQALSALEEFKRLSGLCADQIFLAGHSLGARVALQSATMNPEKVAGLILLGTQVNLSTNVQSEFFTGTTDTALPWVQALGPANPPVPILMISGEWDDILTPENAELLFEKLTGREYKKWENKYRVIFSSTEDVPERQLYIYPRMFHNYEPFSPKVTWAIRSWPVPYTFFQVNPRDLTDEEYFQISQEGDLLNADRYRQLLWTGQLRMEKLILGFLGLLLAFYGANRWVDTTQKHDEYQTTIKIISSGYFLWGKLLLWLAALPLAGILGSIFFLVPLGKPVFNLIYVGFIGGYGILLLLLYWRGKMPGVQGKLPFSAAKAPVNWKRILGALGITAGMLVLTAAYARTGWFYVPPANIRMLWLAIFTPFTALGFWIGLHEAQALPKRRGAQMTLTLIGLFPFFLYTILMAIIGSLSGMIGGLQGLLILWLVLAFGKLVQAIGQRPWLTAICMAVLLYWLILPQGVLFG